MSMSQETKSLLLSCDEADAYEFPKNFNEKAIEKRARLVFSSLASLGIRVKFEDWICNQDASFGLAIPIEEFSKVEGRVTYMPCIRFSNFGNLATLTFAHRVPSSDFQGIVKIVEENGFRYVSESELDCPYDGVMKGDRHLPTWWVRYFSWL